MYAWRRDGSFDGHLEVDDIDDRLHHAGHNCGSARASGAQHGAVRTDSKERGHTRSWALAGGDQIGRLTDKPKRIGHAGLRRKVVHLIVQQDARLTSYKASTKCQVYRRG